MNEIFNSSTLRKYSLMNKKDFLKKINYLEAQQTDEML